MIPVEHFLRKSSAQAVVADAKTQLRGSGFAFGDGIVAVSGLGSRGFPKLGVPFWGVRIMRIIVLSILGSILGFPYFGKLPYRDIYIYGV